MRLFLLIFIILTLIKCGSEVNLIAEAEAKYDVDTLVDELDSSDWQNREAALVSLMRLNDKKTIEDIKEKLNDPEPHVRIAAIEALRVIDEKNSIDDIIKMVKDKDSRVRLYAVDAVIKSGSKAAKAILFEVYKYDPSPFLRTWAGEILQKKGLIKKKF